MIKAASRFYVWEGTDLFSEHILAAFSLSVCAGINAAQNISILYVRILGLLIVINEVSVCPDMFDFIPSRGGLCSAYSATNKTKTGNFGQTHLRFSADSQQYSVPTERQI
jgi:hypothetical protein